MAWTRQWRRYANISLLIGLVTYLNFVLYLQRNVVADDSKTPNKCVACKCKCPVEHSKEKLITTRIKDLLQIVNKIKLTVPKLSKELESYERDLRLMLRNCKILPNVKNVNTTHNYSCPPEKPTLHYSCPEQYKGSTYGYPYFQTGFLRDKCNRPHTKTSVTLILDRPDMTQQNFLKISDYAKMNFHKIFVIIDKQFLSIANLMKHNMGLQNFTFMIFDKIMTLGANLNQAVSQTTTEFVLIAPYLGKLDPSSDLERMINVLEMSGVDVVGSAVKNVLSGEWDRGCYQSELKLHQLKYTYGYYKSRFECLYCDYIVSPFLTRTSSIQELSFPPFTHGMYRELFLQLKGKGITILVCPDIMFYQRVSGAENTNNLIDFANGRMIRKMIDGKGNKHEFPGPTTLTTSLAVPYNARQNLAHVIQHIMKECENASIKCELQEGTLMGAVKFNHVLLWERDADITVLSSDFKKFRQLSPRFKKKGYVVKLISKERCCFENVTTGGVVNIMAKGWSIEIYGQHKLTTKDGPRTKIRFANDFVYGPENPGLYIRNRYGREIYKHAEHWMSTGKTSGWDMYKSGSFLACHKPGHHACLDQFKADGDIQFHQFL